MSQVFSPSLLLVFDFCFVLFFFACGVSCFAKVLIYFHVVNYIDLFILLDLIKKTLHLQVINEFTYVFF